MVTVSAELERARQGIEAYLRSQKEAGLIAGTYYDAAVASTMPNLENWLQAEALDAISPQLRGALRTAIAEERWEELTNAFSRQVAFGTGGIREKMGPSRDVVLRLKEEGVDAPIVKGPNTINNITYLLTSAGTARFGRERQPALSSVVIGFDSRVRGRDFAFLIARLFLAYDYTVYLFDEACLYPSVTFAIPKLRADMGVFISASHNDFRYNGYKLSCMNGSQFDPSERDQLYNNYIQTVTFDDIRLASFDEVPEERLWFLGGVKPGTPRLVESGGLAGMPLADPNPEAGNIYAGRTHQIIDLHTMHCDHVKTFLMRPSSIGQGEGLTIGYSAFNGSGRKAVPRLLGEVGFQDVRRIMALDPLDGMFPAFCSDPGREQQPDPGDWRAADVAVSAFQEEYPDAWNGLDMIIGTDPDADRCGVILKVPANQRPAYPHPGTGELRDYSLVSADEAWSLILWYRLMCEQASHGQVPDVEKKFIVLSHTTTDLLVRVARKFGLGVIKTWVGFAQLAAATRAVWDLHRGSDTDGLTSDGRWPAYVEGRTSQSDARCNRSIHSLEAMDARRSINVAALEQSNGFSILGGIPQDDRSLGAAGHVRDKDGTFAAVLVAELMHYAKGRGIHLLDLLDEALYADPDIGLFVTHYEPDPLDGEYEGLAGYTKKRGILDRAESLFQQASAGDVVLAGMNVSEATVYRTGKYDRVNWSGFPDEGYRFFFDADRLSHLTIRPSGTSNALRFHVQLFGGHPSRADIIQEKARLKKRCVDVVRDIRDQIIQ